MQDRFRFRCWCVNKNQWETGKVYLDNEGRIYDDFHRVKEETHIIQQCTGLKDKNGKLIYEGDIIEWKKEKHLVFFNEQNATFGFKTKDNEIHLFNQINTPTRWIEIIGNIYENKDLLVEEKNFKFMLSLTEK